MKEISMEMSDAASEYTVTQAVEYWLEYRRSEVRETTWKSYKNGSSYVVGPLLIGTKVDRYRYRRNGSTLEGAKFIPMLGPTEVTKLTTAQIRAWHKTLSTY